MGLRQYKFEVHWNYQIWESIGWRINKFKNLIKIWINLINEIKSLIEELINLRT
jgi:hypothetical protein